MTKALGILLALLCVCMDASHLYAATEGEHAVTAPPATENCEAYYEKAFRYTYEAESIDVSGFSLNAAAKKGGLAGTAAAFASLYHACLLRQNQNEKAP